jgi:hypothetical protein
LGLVGISPALQQALASFLASPDFIEAVGQSTASSLAPLGRLPVEFIIILGWGGGVLSHIVRVFYRTGRRQQHKLDIINREMTDLHGADWRYTVTDKEYRPIREWVRRRFKRRLDFTTHAINTTLNTIITLMILPIVQQVLLNFTQSDFIAQLPVLILVVMLGVLLIHGIGVAIAELFDTGRERQIQREVAKEKARLGLDTHEKAKNSLSSIDKRKNSNEDNYIGVRLTADGELSESTVSQFYEMQGLANEDNNR